MHNICKSVRYLINVSIKSLLNSLPGDSIIEHLFLVINRVPTIKVIVIYFVTEVKIMLTKLLVVWNIVLMVLLGLVFVYLSREIEQGDVILNNQIEVLLGQIKAADDEILEHVDINTENIGKIAEYLNR